MIFIIISVLVYVLSVFGSYKYIQVSYSQGGQWSNIHPDLGDVFVTFCPFVNSVIALGWIDGRPERNKRKRNLNGFYKVKK